MTATIGLDIGGTKIAAGTARSASAASATSIVRIDLLISPLLAATLEAGAAVPKLPQAASEGRDYRAPRSANPGVGPTPV